MAKNYYEANEFILNNVDIVKHISGFVSLMKRGANYRGNCPFHKEKTPSLFVSPRKGIWKCFGCGNGGDVIGFDMLYKNNSWADSIQEFSKQLNIELDSKKSKEEREILLRHRNMLTVAANFYHSKIHEIKDYLDLRKITNESVEVFNLGYSGKGDSLVDYLTKKGFSLEDILSQGLIISKENPYERFTNRLMFPINDGRGEIVGFSGRILPSFEDKKKIAKYLNSPESDLYRKSEILYGLDIAKKKFPNLKELFLVEGYTDVIAFFQNKLPSVAHSGGGALTDIQAEKIRRFEQIVNVGDNDSQKEKKENSGVNIVKRNISKLLEKEVHVRAILLPGEEDPASFFEKYSREDFDKLRRLNLAEFYFETTPLSSPDEKTQVLDEIVKELNCINDPIKKYLWIEEVAEKFAIPPSFVARKYSNEINQTIKKNDAGDYFSRSFINNLSAAFVFKIISSHPEFASSYLHDVPISEIPDDGSIFSPEIFELYKKLSNQFPKRDYNSSLFGINHENDQLSLFEVEKQKELNSKKMEYLINYPMLFSSLSQFNGDSSLEKLAKILRTEIFLKKQNDVLNEISDRLSSGGELSEADIKKAKKIYKQL